MATIGLSGGSALDQKLREIAEKAGKAGTLSVGFLEGATYPDGTSVPMVAAIQEYGAPAAGIPARSYFRTMIEAKKGNWGKSLGAIAVANGYDMDKTLNLMGEGIKGQLQESIKTADVAPLSPVTVMLRGMKSHDQRLVVTGATVGEAARRVAAGETNYGASTKPLNESGHLQNSVGYEVKS